MSNFLRNFDDIKKVPHEFWEDRGFREKGSMRGYLENGEIKGDRRRSLASLRSSCCKTAQCPEEFFCPLL